jgi:hypothetical protein
MSEVLNLFPKTHLATAAIQFYLKKVDWFIHPIHLPTIREQWIEIYNDLNENRDPNPFYLAVFFAMCGIGKSTSSSSFLTLSLSSNNL